MTKSEATGGASSDEERDDELDRQPTDPSGSLGGLQAEDRRPTDPSGSEAKASASRASRSAAPRPATTPERRRRDPGLDDEHVGKTFGSKYRIDRLIAKGGMGRVYRATQFPLERPVALKILNTEFQQADPTFVRRFFLEASIAAKLSHPHTITVFDYGEGDSGELYIAMEYLRGRSLSRSLSKRGPFNLENAIRIAIQIARALREAHSKGIIHRDLKPGNVFLLDGEDDAVHAKVLDFGLVKLFSPNDPETGEARGNMLGKDQDLTRTGTLLGSPKYMSPEQIQGLPLDPRTDIYSFGIILFYMIAGKAPFTGATGVDVIYKHVNHAPPRIHTVNPVAECPAEVEDLIRRCLAKKREDRYASMQDIIVDLKEILRHATGNESMSDFGPMLRQAQAAEASVSQPREASFRENLEPEEPTPTGIASRDAGESYSAPNRLPLLLAALGFLVALSALGFVLWGQSERRSAEPPVQVEVPPAAPKKAEPPVKTAEPIPAAPPRKMVAEPEPPAVEDEPPAGDAAPAEVKTAAPKTTRKRADRRRRKVRRRPPVRAKTTTPPKEASSPKSGESDKGEKLDLPPAYRDNPY